VGASRGRGIFRASMLTMAAFVPEVMMVVVLGILGTPWERLRGGGAVSTVVRRRTPGSGVANKYTIPFNKHII